MRLMMKARRLTSRNRRVSFFGIVSLRTVVYEEYLAKYFSSSESDYGRHRYERYGPTTIISCTTLCAGVENYVGEAHWQLLRT